MNAFHAIWSAPTRAGKHRSALPDLFDAASADLETRLFPDYLLITTVLSALKWRQLNGEIKLYTDQPTAAYLERHGLLQVWSDVDTSVLSQINTAAINPMVFWSAGKIFAYAAEPAPCVSLDTDIIIWRALDEFYDCPVRAMHWESTKGSRFYSDPLGLSMPPEFRVSAAWDWANTMPANTSTLYFGDQAFKDFYTGQAIQFMTNNMSHVRESRIVTPEMLFVDQWLLTFCAASTGTPLEVFLDLIWEPQHDAFFRNDVLATEWDPPSVDPSKLATHIWFYKQRCERSQEFRAHYCERLLEILRKEFAAWHRRLISVITP